MALNLQAWQNPELLSIAVGREASRQAVRDFTRVVGARFLEYNRPMASDLECVINNFFPPAGAKCRPESWTISLTPAVSLEMESTETAGGNSLRLTFSFSPARDAHAFGAGRFFLDAVKKISAPGIVIERTAFEPAIWMNTRSRWSVFTQGGEESLGRRLQGFPLDGDEGSAYRLSPFPNESLAVFAGEAARNLGLTGSGAPPLESVFASIGPFLLELIKNEFRPVRTFGQRGFYGQPARVKVIVNPTLAAAVPEEKLSPPIIMRSIGARVGNA